MMSQHESDWYEQVRQHWAKADATKPSKGRKKAWVEALVAPSETELEAREEKAKDRDWLYIEQRREVYSTVKLAWDIVDRSGVVGLVEQWRVEDGLITNRGGRRLKVSIHAALTLWLLLAIQREAQHFQDMGRKIAFGLTPAIWDLLGLKEEKFDVNNRRQRRKIRERWADRVWYTIWVTRETMEPYPEIRLRERYTVGEWLDLVPGGQLDVNDDEETAAFREKRRARGTEFTNRLIWASVELMAPEAFAEWDGTVAVDGTSLQVSKRGNPSKKRLKNGSVPESALMASTPVAGWHHKETGDHDGENPETKGGTFAWGFEATLAAMTGDGFAERGGNPGLIIGMGFHRPGVNPTERLWEALQNVTERPELPRGFMLFDRLYPAQKPEGMHIPLREQGYDLVFDYKDKERGLQTVLPSGVVVIDGGLYSPGIQSFPGLIDPHSQYEAGQIDYETYMVRLEGRKRFALATKGKKTERGDRRFRCPVKAPGSALACALVARGDEKPTAKQRLELTISDVSGFSAAPPAICRQASVTIKNSVEDGARWLQQGPAYGTPEWQSVYGQRNMIESRNDKLKNSRGIGIGDSTVRLMRGWAGQLLATAISCVAVNILLLASDSAWFDDDSTDNDPTPRGRNELDRKRSDRALAGTFPNAPPVAA